MQCINLCYSLTSKSTEHFPTFGNGTGAAAAAPVAAAAAAAAAAPAPAPPVVESRPINSAWGGRKHF